MTFKCLEVKKPYSLKNKVLLKVKCRIISLSIKNRDLFRY